MSTPLGKFVWFEYASKDPKKAQAFYGEVFGWRAQDVPMGPAPYQMIAVGDKTIGGYAAAIDDRSHWLSHLLVADAAATAGAVVRAGGKVAMKPTRMGDYGTMARITDPLGAALCVWQPAKPEAESGEVADGHFAWNELWTVDVARSLAFYQAIAGYEVRTMKMGEGDYHLLVSGGAERGGVMKSDLPNVPQMWLPYVQVAGVEPALERAKRLGGEVVVPPTDVPEVGRIAILKDSLGAAIGLLAPSR